MSLPEKNLAMLLERTGQPDGFALGEIPLVAPGPGQVLLRVHATSINPVDVKLRGGMPVTPELPGVLHGDVAGEIIAMGPGASDEHPEALQLGDAVYGCAGGVRGSAGALAQYMLVDAQLLARKPQSISFAQAAALPLVSITAWEALFDRARLPEPGPTPARADGNGPRILIQGGAGGVGHIAIQLARAALGADGKICATASTPEKQELVRHAGAVPIDYRKQNVQDYVNDHTGGAGFDVVFDTPGGASLDASFAAVRRGGQVLAIAARSTHDLTPLHGKGVSLHIVFMLQPLLFGEGRAHHGNILRKLAQLVDGGLIRPQLDARRFGFREVAEAHRYFESGAHQGKIVLENDLAD